MNSVLELASRSCYISENIQGSDSWKESRRGKITGTRISALLGRNPFVSHHGAMYDCYKRHDTLMTENMMRGIAGESVIRNVLSFRRNVEIAELGLCTWKEDERFAASPDGAYIEDGSLILVEIKVRSKIDNTTNLAAAHYSCGEYGGFCPASIDSQYYDQIQFTGGILGAVACDYVSYGDKNKELIVVRIPMDPNYFNYMIAIAQHSLNRVQSE